MHYALPGFTPFAHQWGGDQPIWRQRERKRQCLTLAQKFDSEERLQKAAADFAKGTQTILQSRLSHMNLIRLITFTAQSSIHFAPPMSHLRVWSAAVVSCPIIAQVPKYLTELGLSHILLADAHYATGKLSVELNARQRVSYHILYYVGYIVKRHFRWWLLGGESFATWEFTQSLCRGGKRPERWRHYCMAAWCKWVLQVVREAAGVCRQDQIEAWRGSELLFLPLVPQTTHKENVFSKKYLSYFQLPGSMAYRLLMNFSDSLSSGPKFWPKGQQLKYKLHESLLCQRWFRDYCVAI